MGENNQPKSSGRGGARPGAGRKPGSATRRTRAVANQAATTGVTPLEVMIKAMRHFADCADSVGASTGQEAEEKRRLLAAAAAIAKDAAPYMHPRLSAIEHSAPQAQDLGRTLTESERIARLLSILDTAARRVADSRAEGLAQPPRS